MDSDQQIQNEEFQIEIWKPAIKDKKTLPGYEVSNFGRIRNKDGVILKIQNQIPPANSVGKKGARQHINVSVPSSLYEDYKHKKHSKNNVSLTISVHRLVIETFKPLDENPPIPKEDWEKTPESAKKIITDCYIVDHIDNNPLNNRIENLRWVTSKENQTFRKKFELSKINKEEIC